MDQPDVIDHDTLREQHEARIQAQDDATPTFSHYRKCTLGQTLLETLQQFEDEGKITKDLKDEMMLKFDKSMYRTLKNIVSNKVMMRGNIDTYRVVDNVYMFQLKNAETKLDAKYTLKYDSARLVALDDVERDAAPAAAGAKRGGKGGGASATAAKKKRKKPDEDDDDDDEPNEYEDDGADDE